MSDALDVMARTLWGEARSTGITGMKHVASVILNRAKHPRWWGHDVASVCQKPYQFSCWNADDPNLPKMKKVTVADRQFSDARYIAAQAMAGNLIDETGGADSYYALSMTHHPTWAAQGATHTMSDGFHSFWRVELPAPEGEQPPPVERVVVADTSSDDLNAAELNKLRS